MNIYDLRLSKHCNNKKIETNQNVNADLEETEIRMQLNYIFHSK